MDTSGEEKNEGWGSVGYLMSGSSEECYVKKSEQWTFYKSPRGNGCLTSSLTSSLCSSGRNLGSNRKIKIRHVKGNYRCVVYIIYSNLKGLYGTKKVETKKEVDLIVKGVQTYWSKIGVKFQFFYFGRVG